MNSLKSRGCLCNYVRHQPTKFDYGAWRNQVVGRSASAPKGESALGCARTSSISLVERIWAVRSCRYSQGLIRSKWMKLAASAYSPSNSSSNAFYDIPSMRIHSAFLFYVCFYFLSCAYREKPAFGSGYRTTLPAKQCVTRFDSGTCLHTMNDIDKSLCASRLLARLAS